MERQKPINLSMEHLLLLECLESLFSRWSLRRNNYLFRHLKPSLELPLYILAEERRVAQITQSQHTLIEAVRMCELLDLVEESRLIRVRELPTLKFDDEPSFLKTEALLKVKVAALAKDGKQEMSKPLQYMRCAKTEDGFYYLVVKTNKPEHKLLLLNLIKQHYKNGGHEIRYSQEPLYEDIKNSIAKIKKSKKDHGHSNQYTKSSNNNGEGFEAVNSIHTWKDLNVMQPLIYGQISGFTPEQMQMYLIQNSMFYAQNKSYPIFIRKAVESSDEETKVEAVADQQQVQAKSQEREDEKVAKNRGKPKYQQKEEKSENKEPRAKRGQKKKNGAESAKKKSKQKPIVNSVFIDESDFPSIG